MRRILQPTKPETPGQTPSLNDKCTGFFYVHYTTHGTYSFTSHPKDEAIMVKCFAQGHKCRYVESNPHSGFLTTPELESVKMLCYMYVRPYFYQPMIAGDIPHIHVRTSIAEYAIHKALLLPNRSMVI